MQILYTAHATATGGRDGRATTSDNRLDVKLNTPKELGGGGGDGTNPEQLFAAGYSACFLSAMKFVAEPIPRSRYRRTRMSRLQSASARTIKVDSGLAADLRILIPGMDPAAAQALVDKAHQVCPYSNATRGNIEVNVSVV